MLQNTSTRVRDTMVVQQHIRVSICFTVLLFLTCSISETTSTHPLDHHRQFDSGKSTVTQIRPWNRGRAGSRDGGPRAGGSGRLGGISGSQNCDPLYLYLFGRCGRWPFPRNSPNNPFTSRPPPRRPPRSPPPLIVPSPPPPQPPPLVPSPPPPPLVPSPPPPSPSPPPPLVPSPPPPVELSPPPDYILPPAVPELPYDDPFQAPPISFSPPAFDINPPPLVPIFSPPEFDTGPIPELPPLTDPGLLFPPELPFTFTPPVESTMAGVIMPPPVDEEPVTEVQPLP